MQQQMIPLGGIFVFTILVWLFSRSFKAINWRLILWVFVFQFLFGWFVFRTSAGQDVFAGLNIAVIATVDAALEGPKFVFGSLADTPASFENGVGFVLFTQGLASILVFSALLAILYHVGIMGLMLRIFSAVFSRLTKISGAESRAATANVFVGNESLLAIRPCLPKLTRSEFGVVLTTCMATISANVIGVYVGALKAELPSIAGHLVSASILSVPIAVMYAKLAIPETENPETLGVNVAPHYDRENNLIEAVLGGGEVGFKMLVGITSMLVAVVGLLAIANMIVGWCGDQLNPMLGWTEKWSIQTFFGYFFYPFVWLMGVPVQDIPVVAKLLGTRIIATEVPAYYELSGLIKSNSIDPRSAVIASYALCGFAHLPSLAIYVGGATALAPERKSDIAAVAWRALIAATLACLATGCIAAVFFSGETALLKSS